MGVRALLLIMKHFLLAISIPITIVFAGLILVVGIVVVPNSAQAQEAMVKDLVVANSETKVLLYLMVDNAFTPQMEEGIKNGIPVTFTFNVELLQKRQDWPNKQLAAFTFNHTLSYDNLKDEYQVKMMEKAGRVLASKSLVDAKKIMIEINGYELAALDSLVRGTIYAVRVKVTLAKRSLPLNFHYLVPFWGLGDFETEYREIEFRY